MPLAALVVLVIGSHSASAGPGVVRRARIKVTRGMDRVFGTHPTRPTPRRPMRGASIKVKDKRFTGVPPGGKPGGARAWHFRLQGLMSSNGRLLKSLRENNQVIVIAEGQVTKEPLNPMQHVALDRLVLTGYGLFTETVYVSRNGSEKRVGVRSAPAVAQLLARPGWSRVIEVQSSGGGPAAGDRPTPKQQERFNRLVKSLPRVAPKAPVDHYRGGLNAEMNWDRLYPVTD